jgi:hypothetical protein
MQDDFLVGGVGMVRYNAWYIGLTSGDIFFPYFSDRNCIVRPTFDKYSEATPVSTSKAILDVPGRSVSVSKKRGGWDFDLGNQHALTLSLPPNVSNSQLRVD